MFCCRQRANLLPLSDLSVITGYEKPISMALYFLNGLFVYLTVPPPGHFKQL